MIEIKHLSKSFSTSDGELEALRDISLTISDGEIFGIIGRSGAGKSTLIRCINRLERPTSGQILLDGCDIGSLPEKELLRERRKIGMIFQHFNLLMQQNCLKNVCFPLELAGVKKGEAILQARELLATVGLSDKEKAYPSQLSGGQQQRVAIARALATHPKVLLCDEATSALDPQTTHSILSLIREINQKLSITVVLITHQLQVVEEICSQVAILDKGKIVETGPVRDVLAFPKSEAGRRLVYPESFSAPLFTHSGDAIIRVVFNGAIASGTPLIAKLAMEKQIAANILSASTKSIGEKAYGNMLLGIPNDKGQAEQAIAYMRSIPDILVEEIEPTEIEKEEGRISENV
jgi:D-methionine transport system ATP-binding protein